MTDRHLYPPLSLRAIGLSCGRGGMALTRDLDFSLSNGQCLLLRGPNGSGKSTLLLTLAGVVSPLDGDHALDGADEDCAQIHYCGHRNAVKARLTVAENLDFWAAINGRTGIGTAAALDQVGLASLGDLDAGYLSAGQSRRLALARLLVSQRPLWLLDEPTAALDTDGHALVTRLIDAHLDRGGLVVAATHDPITLSDTQRLHVLTLEAEQ